MTDTTTTATAGDRSHADEPPSYLVYAAFDADWHAYLPESLRGPLGYCLTSQADAPFDPATATAELAERGWVVVGGADGWTEHPPGDGEHQWTAQVAVAATKVPTSASVESEDAGPVAVPAALMNDFRDRLDEELEGTRVDTGALALDLARIAVRHHEGGGHRPGVVL
jgi:hypothetical protein